MHQCVYCPQTPEDSYWTEERDNSDPGYPRKFTHAYKALDDFEAWMNENENSLPPFDAAMLFSGWATKQIIKSHLVVLYCWVLLSQRNFLEQIHLSDCIVTKDNTYDVKWKLLMTYFEQCFVNMHTSMRSICVEKLCRFTKWFSDVFMMATCRSDNLYRVRTSFWRKSRVWYLGPLLLTWANFKLHMHKWLHPYKMRREFTYPFQNFNGALVEVWQWMSNSIPSFTGRVLTYACWS